MRSDNCRFSPTDLAEARAVQRQALAFRLQCRLDFMAKRGMESVGISKGLATELVQALTDRPAETSVDRVCHDEQMMIWTGEIAEGLSMGGYLRDDLSYDDNLDVHAVICRDLRGIIGSALIHPGAFAPVDEPRHGEDAIAAEGRSPAGAVAEGQAPDLTALQDEIQSLRSALQDSERKRVAAETILHRLCAATNDQGWTPVGYAECVAEISRDARALLAPTQETPNAQG